MEFYHASKMVFSIGEEISSATESSYYPDATKALDSHRPEYAPSRRTSFYSFDSSIMAFYYITKQQACKNAINLYKVNIKAPWQAVFNITRIVQRRIEQKQSTDALISEYWNPTQEWNIYEYLSSSFVICEQLELPECDYLLLDFEMKFKVLGDDNRSEQ